MLNLYLYLTLCWIGWMALSCCGEKHQHHCKYGGLTTNHTNVPGPPRIKIPKCNPSQIVDGHFVMTCEVLANPAAIITWQHNGKTLTPEDFQKIDKLSCNQRFEISNVLKEHSGVYTCTATNSFGSTNKTCTLSVEDKKCPLVHAGIYFVRTSLKKGNVLRAGSSMNITCTVHNKRLIFWRKDGKVYTGAPRIQGPSSSTIIFARVNASDSGNYTCIARGYQSNCEVQRSKYLQVVDSLATSEKRSKAVQAEIQAILSHFVVLFWIGSHI